tara:strand:+ start:11337 stop:12962 length:1626 start_codon:yes stop_codon:yes gene_type:complete
MYILGISGGVRLGYHDIGAALLKDGKLVAAVEEERINRIKHSPGQLPQKSIYTILESEKISIQDVDILATHGITWGDIYDKILKDYFEGEFGFCPPIEKVHHHDAHAASAYYASGFNEAIIITMDGSGDGVSCEFCIGKGDDMEILQRFDRPNSLGIFYSMITQYCGFTRDSDEYKLMGLSSYGDRNKFDFSKIIYFENGELKLDTSYIKTITPKQSQPTKQEMIFSEKLTDEFGPKRLKKQELSTYYKDIAASAQAHVEKVIIQMIDFLHKKTGIKKLCLAGGVALNCAANQKIMNLEYIDDLYVQPASNDEGVAIGATYLVGKKHGLSIKPMDSVYVGPSYTNEEIKDTLDILNLNYRFEEDPALFAAKKVSENHVIGWFQGKMEIGPRALGARSILANPTHPDMRDIVNKKIKFRDTFRPFCPSVIEEDMSEYFIGKQPIAPHMTINYDVVQSMIAKIPSVVHVDNTARIQTVNETQNKLYYNFLNHLKSLIGIGVCLNTSFNVNNEPIVNTPREAVATFYGSGMDCLIIGNYVLEKS